MTSGTRILTSGAVGLALVALSLAGCVVPPSPPPGTTTTTTAPPRPTVGYGVHTSTGRRTDGPATAAAAGARWARVNVELDGSAAAGAAVTQWLDAGFDVVVTVVHRQNGNVVTTYGTPAQWPKAGFPALSTTTLAGSVTALVTPWKPYLDRGRTILIQSENEIGDASLAPNGPYWRGTTAQYVALETALHDAVKGVDGRFGVVLTSAASANMQAVLDPANPNHAFQENRLTTILHDGAYDAFDAHFYGCTTEIAGGAAWINAHLRPGAYWISTELSSPTAECPALFSNWRTDLTRFEQTKAAQVAPTLQACAAGGARVCLWFSLFNLDGEVDTFNHLGLVQTNGTRNPAFDSFRAAVSG